MRAKFDTGIILSNKIPKVLVFLGIAFVLYIFNFSCLAFLSAVIAIFLGYVYRNPERYIYRDDKELVSPIDGIVDAVDGKKIYVYVRLCDSSVIRMPMDGKFVVSNFKNGANVEPFMPKAKILNESVLIQFGKMSALFIGGLYGEKINLYNHDFNLSKGDRIGSFVNGLVEITLDENMVASVSLGQNVRAGETTLGEEIRG